MRWAGGGGGSLLPPPCPAKPGYPHAPRNLCPWRRNTWPPPTFLSWKPDDSTPHCRQRELMASCLTPLWPGISRAQESRVVNLGFLKFLLFSGHLTTSKSKDPKRSVQWESRSCSQASPSCPGPALRLPPQQFCWPLEARGLPVPDGPRPRALVSLCSPCPGSHWH